MATLSLIVDPSGARDGARAAGREIAEYTQTAKQAVDTTDEVNGSFDRLVDGGRRVGGVVAGAAGSMARLAAETGLLTAVLGGGVFDAFIDGAAAGTSAVTLFAASIAATRLANFTRSMSVAAESSQALSGALQRSGLTEFGITTDSVSGSLGRASSRLTAFVGGVGALRLALAGLAIGGFVIGLGALTLGFASAQEQVVNYQASLVAVTGSLNEGRDAFARAIELTDTLGGSLDANADAFRRFLIATEEIGASNDEVQRFIESFQRLGRIGGSTQQEISGASIQLAQGLAAGRLQGDELRSILESMPLVGRAIAQELNVSVGELKELGSEGRIVSEDVFAALLNQYEDINRQAENLPRTMGQASNALNAQVTLLIGGLGDALGVAENIAHTVDVMAGVLREVNLLFGFVEQSAASAAQATLESLEAQAARIRSEIFFAENSFFGLGDQETVNVLTLQLQGLNREIENQRAALQNLGGAQEQVLQVQQELTQEQRDARVQLGALTLSTETAAMAAEAYRQGNVELAESILRQQEAEQLKARVLADSIDLIRERDGVERLSLAQQREAIQIADDAVEAEFALRDAREAFTAATRRSREAQRDLNDARADALVEAAAELAQTVAYREALIDEGGSIDDAARAREDLALTQQLGLSLRELEETQIYALIEARRAEEDQITREIEVRRAEQRQQEEQARAIQAELRELDREAERFNESFTGVFADAFVSTLDGFENFGDTLVRGFQDLAAEIFRQRIVVPIVAELTGTGDIASAITGQGSSGNGLFDIASELPVSDLFDAGLGLFGGGGGFSVGGTAVAAGTSAFGPAIASSALGSFGSSGISLGFGSLAGSSASSLGFGAIPSSTALSFGGGASSALGGLAGGALSAGAGIAGSFIGSQLFEQRNPTLGSIGAAVGGIGGGLAGGALAGAAAGSIVPGIGNVIGALIGAILGSALGRIGPPPPNEAAGVTFDPLSGDELTRGGPKDPSDENISAAADIGQAGLGLLQSLALATGTNPALFGTVGGDVSVRDGSLLRLTEGPVVASPGNPDGTSQARFDFLLGEDDDIAAGVVQAFLATVGDELSEQAEQLIRETLTPDGSIASANAIDPLAPTLNPGDLDLDRLDTVLTALTEARFVTDALATIEAAASGTQEVIGPLEAAMLGFAQSAEESRALVSAAGIALDDVNELERLRIETLREQTLASDAQLLRQAEGRSFLDEIAAQITAFTAQIDDRVAAGIDPALITRAFEVQLETALGNLDPSQLQDLSDNLADIAGESDLTTTALELVGSALGDIGDAAEQLSDRVRAALDEFGLGVLERTEGLGAARDAQLSALGVDLSLGGIRGANTVTQAQTELVAFQDALTQTADSLLAAGRASEEIEAIVAQAGSLALATFDTAISAIGQVAQAPTGGGGFDPARFITGRVAPEVTETESALDSFFASIRVDLASLTTSISADTQSAIDAIREGTDRTVAGLEAAFSRAQSDLLEQAREFSLAAGTANSIIFGLRDTGISPGATLDLFRGAFEQAAAGAAGGSPGGIEALARSSNDFLGAVGAGFGEGTPQFFEAQQAVLAAATEAREAAIGNASEIRNRIPDIRSNIDAQIEAVQSAAAEEIAVFREGADRTTEAIDRAEAAIRLTGEANLQLLGLALEALQANNSTSEETNRQLVAVRRALSDGLRNLQSRDAA